MKYAFFDGDGIGDTLEILLTENRVQEAAKFSRGIIAAFEFIDVRLKQEPGIKILLIGGDDLLIEFNEETHGRVFLQEIANIFNKYTGHSISCGVGNDASEATRNLYLAKLYGKNRIFGDISS